jgi:C4-dicarboxylate transporter DctM subunit
MLAFLVFLCFIILILIGIPIALAMILTGMLFQLYFGGGVARLLIAFNRLSSGFSYSLLAIFFFIFLGVMMNETKLSDVIVDFLRKITRRIFKYGRTGAILILSCAATGVLTGSAIGTATAVGSIVIPQMNKLQYDKKYSTTLLAYSGILGSLIPPSITGLIYAVIVGLPVLTVWIAVGGAGILYALLLVFANHLISKKRNYEVYNTLKESEESLSSPSSNLKNTFFKTFPALLVPIGIIGTIYGGIATPTESGSIGALITLILGLFYYKTITSFKQISRVLFASAYQTAMVMFLMCASFSLSHVLITTGIIKKITIVMLLLTDNKYILLLLTELLLLILGCFLDDVPIMILLAPIATSILVPIGVHPVHLAVIFVFCVMIGLVTPPVGSVLYASSAVTGVPVGSIIKNIFLFLWPALVVLLIITFVPSIALFLPKIFGLI